MKKIIPRIAMLVCVSLGYSFAVGQTCENMNMELVAELPSTCFQITMTMLHDQLDRPYLYVASKEGGLKVYKLDNGSQPSLVGSVPVAAFENLHVMNLSQSGHYVYLALGNHFTNPEKSGMAIVDVTLPELPNLTDYWILQAEEGGGGIVKVEGDYAYLGAMHHGLVILDVSDKSAIGFKSRFVPPLDFPTANPDPTKINARGIEVKNGIVYLAYDAGGLRIIDASNPLLPVELGRYSNPVLNGLPRAYNNLVLDGNLVYVTLDYCGLEVLDVSNPAQITPLAWWNPWNCQTSPLNWFASPGHTNEIAINKDCKRLFLSAGKSDLLVLDISNPAQPDSCNFYGGVDNGIGTWGVSVWQDKIFLSYICSFIPFSSNWTGVKVLSYNDCTATTTSFLPKPEIAIRSNPVIGQLTVELSPGFAYEIRVFDAVGRLRLQRPGEEKAQLDFSNLDDGIYFLHLQGAWGSKTERIVKMDGW